MKNINIGYRDGDANLKLLTLESLIEILQEHVLLFESTQGRRMKTLPSKTTTEKISYITCTRHKYRLVICLRIY